jgi:hypothetical protein
MSLWDRFRRRLDPSEADLSGLELREQKRVAARDAGVLAERPTWADERHPVTQQHARERMTDE